MIKIISREEALNLALKGERVFQVDLRSEYVFQVGDLKIDEMVKNKDVFYCIGENKND